MRIQSEKQSLLPISGNEGERPFWRQYLSAFNRRGVDYALLNGIVVSFWPIAGGIVCNQLNDAEDQVDPVLKFTAIAGMVHSLIFTGCVFLGMRAENVKEKPIRAALFTTAAVGFAGGVLSLYSLFEPALFGDAPSDD